MTAGLRLANVNPENSPLPELQDAILDPETLAQLFQDIQHCAVVDGVFLKGGSAAMVSGASVPLDEAQAALQEGTALGVQIRYWYNGTRWWDTLMRTPQGIRLIRIEHRLA